MVPTVRVAVRRRVEQDLARQDVARQDRARQDSGPELGARPSRLTVGQITDTAEVEADRFADSLISDLHARPTMIHRAAVGVDRLGGTAVDVDTESRIRSASGGRPLPDHLRAATEQRTGADLSRVRVHTGRRADELSRSLDAAAFTVGTDIFVSNDSYRPGTAEGDHLLAHEVGHAVQQHGGANRSIRRLPRFGRKKDPSKAAANQPDVSGMKGPDGTAAMSKKELETAIKALEKSLVKLTKKRSHSEADWSAAFVLRDAARGLMDKLPDQDDKSSKVLGRVYTDETRRIGRVIDEAQLIYDQYRVRRTQQQADKIYEQAGRDTVAGKVGGFKHLKARLPFQDVGGQSDKASAFHEAPLEIAKRLESQAALLGLTKGEIASIATFTGQDYLYINPATANSDAWMQKSNAAAMTTDRASLFEEGSLHTAMALRGLARLPVWTGTTYRGQSMEKEQFEQNFEQHHDGTLTVKQKRLTRSTLASTSKNESKARAFMVGGGEGSRMVLFEHAIINGRDVEQLSVNRIEEEVLTLPGAQFEIVSAEVLMGGVVRVQVKQIR